MATERAAQFPGLSRPEFLAELARRHVFVVEKDDLGQELSRNHLR
jgi:hypothetical protein